MRTDDPEVRKQELLSIAMELFLEVGFEKLNVNEIAKKAGVSKGLLYYYFRSKEEILIESVKQEVKKFAGIYASSGQTPQTPPLESFKLLIQSAREYFQVNFDLATNLHKPENTFMHNAMTEISNEYLSPIVADVIKRGKETGVFSCGYPEKTASVLVYGITEAFHTHPISVFDGAFFEIRMKEQLNFLVFLFSRLLGLKEEDAIKIFE